MSRCYRSGPGEGTGAPFRKSLRHADVSMEELWLRYFTLGGLAGQFEVEAYIHGAMALPSLQRDVLAHALNERLDEMLSPAPRAPYSKAPSSRGDEDEDAGDNDAGGEDVDGGEPRGDD
jgi:hypothetical protein